MSGWSRFWCHLRCSRRHRARRHISRRQDQPAPARNTLEPTNRCLVGCVVSNGTLGISGVMHDRRGHHFDPIRRNRRRRGEGQLLLPNGVVPLTNRSRPTPVGQREPPSPSDRVYLAKPSDGALSINTCFESAGALHPAGVLPETFELHPK